MALIRPSICRAWATIASWNAGRCSSATSFESAMARVLAISSHVVRGTVGLDATVPALQHLGHEVWALPTVLLSSRPGLGQLVKHELPAAALADILAALEA